MFCCIWLAESVHRTFVADARKQSLDIWTDAQLYEAFDMEYQYDIHGKFMDCFKGEIPKVGRGYKLCNR